MNKEKTINEIESILFDLKWTSIKIGKVGIESDYVYQARFNQFVMKLDEIRNDLYKIKSKL